MKTLSLVNMPALNDTELIDRTGDWTEMLHGIVPEQWLDRCLQNAMHEQKGGFAIGCPAIIEAYKRLTAMGLVKPDSALDNGHTVERVGVCLRCFNTGHERVFDLTGKHIGTRKANTCDHRPPLQGEGLFYRVEEDRQESRRHLHVLPQEVLDAAFPDYVKPDIVPEIRF